MASEVPRVLRSNKLPCHPGRVDCAHTTGPLPKTAPPATERGRRQEHPTDNRRSLDALHVGGVKSLRTRLDLELDLLPLGERLEAIHRDRGEVHEDILAPFLLDEAIPLGIIEPLYFPSGHCARPPPE